MTPLTHRDRIMKALQHEEPDFVPLDFATGGSTSPVPEFSAALAAHYGLPTAGRLLTHILRLTPVDERILCDLDIDTRGVYMTSVRKGVRPCEEPGAFYDDFGVKWHEMNLGAVRYRELAESPLAAATIDDLDAYPWWPDPEDLDRFHKVGSAAAALYEQTDFAVIGCPAFNGIWERAWYLCGLERTLESLLLDVEFVHAVLRRLTDLSKAALGRFLELVGPYIQVIKMGDDLGTQGGPMMSPKTYRAVVKPYHKELCDFIKARTAARIYLHTCGSVYALLPDLVEAGFDILNPVQVTAAGMDTGRLKAQFGDRLSFWGAIDTQHVLPHGSTGDVEQEVERRIRDLGRGGGYVLAPVHNVQGDVPVENLLTMYRHARLVGRYPII